VAVFSFLIYYIGYRLRAGETEWNQLHVVDVVPMGEQADMRGRSYGSIYSPVNSRYRLASQLPVATFRGEYMGAAGRTAGARGYVEQRGQSFQAEIQVPVWTSQLYATDWAQRTELPLGVSLTRHGTSWTVAVQNHLDQKLGPVKLALEEYIFDLGEILPNQTFRKTFTGTSERIASMVQNHAGNFREALNRRQQAFGNNRILIDDAPQAAIAASFISQLNSPGAQHEGVFITPPGFELTRLVQRGKAVLLAWVPDYGPIEPINQFPARRTHQDTLWRMAVEIGHK
jgi:hypothetical protein